MGFFNQRKPRGFNHQYIYVDERRERLKEMEEIPQKYNFTLDVNLELESEMNMYTFIVEI